MLGIFEVCVGLIAISLTIFVVGLLFFLSVFILKEEGFIKDKKNKHKYKDSKEDLETR